MQFIIFNEEVSKDTYGDIKYAVINDDGNYYSYERADSIRIYAFSLVDNLEYVIEDFSRTDTTIDNMIVSVDTIDFWGEKRIQICNYSFNPFSEYHILQLKE